ncbi:MAG: lamin tail domain-containing protein [Methanomicrobiaceae archaeon]|nr:lamin tail domain-containing protein [Methanomicrobiaceae archaeon]
MAKKRGSKRKNSKNMVIGIAVILLIAFSGYSYEEGYFPDEFYPGEKEEIVTGAFNIQVFGTTKASNEDVMEIISDIICRYDIIAIQEIRDSSGTAIEILMEKVKEKNPDYEYVIGERLGRTSSKEQYAYIYNTEKTELVGTPKTYPEDPGTDPFHREPFIASFRSKEGDFIGTFATIHTDPDEAESEIAALTGVAEYCMELLPEDEMIILMGDFNADCTYFNEEGPSPLRSGEYNWLIGNELDTTTKSTICTYDRIVVAGDYQKYYSGESGAIHFDEIYGTDQEMTEDVSDHYPVYAKFYTRSKGFAGSIDNLNNPGNSTETCDTCNPGEIEITGLNLNDEWVTISNKGKSSVNITNWRISNSENTHSYIFPMASVVGDETITLYSGKGENSEDHYYWNTGDEIWNDAGDTAELYDEKGNRIDSFTA